ncbi:MAG: DUF1801 domain-containing protein [Saprospiraceae bacterium]|nr:DUF1801 domain-containing protein [Saprospiraceae bacterium]
MTSKAELPEDYINALPEDRKPIINALRTVILTNLSQGFEETMNYGMLSYVVPHSIYPSGYHCNPELPLPFMSLASQKNFVSVYHMGIYADKDLRDWFISEYPKHTKTKLDLGKSCIRFKKLTDIPFSLIGELTAKMTVEQWIVETRHALSLPLTINN